MFHLGLYSGQLGLLPSSGDGGWDMIELHDRSTYQGRVPTPVLKLGTGWEFDNPLPGPGKGLEFNNKQH